MTSMSGTLKRTLWSLAQAKAEGPFQRAGGCTSSDAVLLHIPTSDGSGQACHPSVAFAEGGVAGFRYWMANTPYADHVHKLENPEVYASQDGLFWQVPPGCRNPLVPPPAGDERHYHSDPCLLIHDQRLLLYFRTSDEEAVPRRDRLSLIVSDDGCRWTAPLTVVEARGGLLLSPAVRVIAGEFRMWTVDRVPGSDHLAVAERRSRNGIDWSLPVFQQLLWPETPLEPWHIDVVEHRGRLIMALSARAPGRPGTQRWHVAHKDGARWRVRPGRTAERCGFENGRAYKASLVAPTRDAPAGWLYTSSEGADDNWHTALRPGPFADE